MANMIDCGSNAATVLGQLATPARNRYYYGKLLDADHFQLEQDYGNRKRWLLNRLSLGTGVLCGLDVTVTTSTAGAQLVVGPGVAIDAVGRELIVPLPSPAINPLQATDECGQPSGTPVTGPTTVTLYICYYECEAEPAPVMVSQCGPDRACECGLVRERYRLQIRPGPLATRPLPCGTFFSALPTTADPDRRQRLCALLDGTCPAPDDTCVPLAEIAIDANGNPTVNKCAGRVTVYSNAVLLDLILCLAERVDACCGGGSTQPTTLPVVTSTWPPNAATLAPNAPAPGQSWFGDWAKSKHIQITFNIAMSAAELAAPDPWLGLFAIEMPPPGAKAGGTSPVRRIPLTYSTSTTLSPPAPSTGVTANYVVKGDAPERAYYLILIEANGGTIQDTQTPVNTLEADYAGTQLSAADIAACWALTPGQSGTLPTADVSSGFVSTGAALPSGSDGVAGGVLHSWFQVTPN